MLKILKNIFAIALIGFIAIGISIYNSPVNNTLNKAVKSTMTNIFLATEDNKEVYFNPDKINIYHVATSDITLNFENDYMFKADIYSDNNLIKSIDLFKIDDKKELNIKSDTSYVTEIDISQNTLDLPNGDYEIILSTNAKNNELYISPLDIKVHYNTSSNYIKAKSEVPQGKMPITLYYPTSDYKVTELIGITRFVDKNNRPLNTMIENLKVVPKNLSGISILPPIGEINYVTSDKESRNLVYVDLPSDEDIYTLDNDKSKASMYSFIKTLTRTSNYDFIKNNTSLIGYDRVKFLVDYQKADVFFRNVDVSKAIKYTWKNKAYLSFNSGDRYYLVDYDVDIKDLSINDKIINMFSTLKNGIKYLGNTIPKNVEILDFKISSNTLTINFNDDFLNSFNNDLNKQNIMLDSILLSFTSIENIKYVNILVNNEVVKSFAGVDISKPLGPPQYINPEK